MPKTRTMADEEKVKAFHMAVWKHNSLFGHTRMAEMNMRDIIKTDTASPEAKQVARDILDKLDVLRFCLHIRIDKPYK